MTAKGRPGTARIGFAVAVLWAAVLLGAGPAPETVGDSSPLYPLEIEIQFHTALFHWVDSLAGTSGGKTIAAHQQEFRSKFGSPSQEDVDMLMRFRHARLNDARQDVEGQPLPKGTSELCRVFLETPNLDQAIERARKQTPDGDVDAIRDALMYFKPRYAEIWNDGRVPSRFSRQFKVDPRLGELEGLLARIARFYGVDPGTGMRPTVVPVPVPDGHGTHATAIGRYLLIEVRASDRLADQASVIVHENAHVMFNRVDDDRLQQMEAMAAHSKRTKRAWHALREALPTALGQGVADREFQPRSWSASRPWYHTDEIDTYAKKLFPLVRYSLENGGRFDEEFLKSALAKFP
jgi:hypothetical protein